MPLRFKQHLGHHYLPMKNHHCSLIKISKLLRFSQIKLNRKLLCFRIKLNKLHHFFRIKISKLHRCSQIKLNRKLRCFHLKLKNQTYSIIINLNLQRLIIRKKIYLLSNNNRYQMHLKIQTSLCFKATTHQTCFLNREQSKICQPIFLQEMKIKNQNNK